MAAKVDTGSGPSHLIGLAFDGFPIYGAREIKGRRVSVAKFDACNGITSATPEFPNGIYHYVLPGTTNATSAIRCFHGKVSSSLTTQMPARSSSSPAGPAVTPARSANPSAPAVNVVCDSGNVTFTAKRTGKVTRYRLRGKIEKLPIAVQSRRPSAVSTVARSVALRRLRRST